MVGDSVLLKAEGTREAWIGLICAFVEEDEAGEKAADFMWFSTEREVWNKQKKRTDALPVCCGDSFSKVLFEAKVMITSTKSTLRLLGT